MRIDKGILRYQKITFFVFASSIVLGFSAIAIGDKSEWQQSYAPRTVEWLAVQLNAMYRKDCYRPTPDDHCIGTLFIPGPGDEIQLVLTTRGNVPLSDYEGELATDKKLIIESAKMYSHNPIKIIIRRIKQ